MEKQIRDLCKGLDDVNVVRVDSANATHIRQIIDSLPKTVPTFSGHHPPSRAEMEALENITFDGLQEDLRHTGKALRITVTQVDRRNGIIITGKDQSGAQGVVWSLFLRPFGTSVVAGMDIVIKEPHFGRTPNSDLAVCVHHPADCVTAAGVECAPVWKPMCSKSDINVRSSSLGGRGLFATRPIVVGSLVLLEKAVALSDSADASAYGLGIDGILQGERTNGRKLALLQQLHGKMLGDKDLLAQFVDLYSGESFSKPDGKFKGKFRGPFHTYRALSIIKHNAHTIFPGNTSDHHDVANRPTRGPKMLSTDQVPGIWLQASMFNHSCLPNCGWAWTGDLFVARASRDIAADEEVTIAYVPSSYDYDKRQGGLRVSNGFDCTCPLCIADAAAARTPEIQDSIIKAQRLPQHAEGSSLKEKTKAAEEVVCRAVAGYPRSIYKDHEGAELPCLQLAEPFYHLAHIVLDRAKNGFNWKATSRARREKARKYFIACIEVGLGYKLVLDPSSSSCELLFLKYSQPRPIGVLSLMALAELAFIDGEEARCRSLKAWAKRLYGIWYGEDSSFKKQHRYFSCKDEPVEGGNGKAPETKEWEKVREQKMRAESVAPTVG